MYDSVLTALGVVFECFCEQIDLLPQTSSLTVTVVAMQVAM